MAIDFPNSPSSGDTYSANGRTWQWDGSSWVLYGNLIDPTVLKVDPSNNRVGINNTTPTSTLDVTGDLSVSSDVTVYGTTNGVGASFTGNLSVGANTDVEASIDAVESDVSTLQTDVTNINELQLNAQSASYTLVLSDAGKLIQMAVSSANTLTVPPYSSVSFPVGTQILVIQQGAGQTTITPGSGVSIFSKDGNLKTSARYSAVTLIKREGGDNWYAIGDLSA